MARKLGWRFLSYVLVGVAPVAASAAVVNGRHDLSATSTGATVRAVTETQSCKFCHVPHGAGSTQLLWSHNPTVATSYGGWGTIATYAGTTLPTTTGITPSAARCYACHDGTVAVGALTFHGIATVIPVTGLGEVDATGRLINPVFVVNPSSMGGNHPVSIPYPGSPAAYNGITSAAAPSGFQPIVTGTACTSPSGVCVAGVNGAVINLIRAGTGYGMECATCHDPHGVVGVTTRFLRIDNNGSQLCLSCHLK